VKTKLALALLLFFLSAFLSLIPQTSEGLLRFMADFGIKTNPVLLKYLITFLFASTLTILYYGMVRNRNPYLIGAAFFLFLLSPAVYLSLLSGYYPKFLLVFSVFVFSYFLLPKTEFYTSLLLLFALFFDPESAIALFPLFLMAYFSDKMEYSLILAFLALGVILFLALQHNLSLSYDLLPSALLAISSVALLFPREDKRDFVGYLATLPLALTGSPYITIPLPFVTKDVMLEEEKKPKALAPILASFIYLLLFLGTNGLLIALFFSLLFLLLSLIFKRKTVWHIFLGLVITLSILWLTKIQG
jgi:hypothetical protein